LYYAPLPERTPDPAEAVDWANAVLDGRPVGPQPVSAADVPKYESRGA
jgi:hypothetical protein